MISIGTACYIICLILWILNGVIVFRNEAYNKDTFIWVYFYAIWMTIMALISTLI